MRCVAFTVPTVPEPTSMPTPRTSGLSYREPPSPAQVAPGPVQRQAERRFKGRVPKVDNSPVDALHQRMSRLVLSSLAVLAVMASACTSASHNAGDGGSGSSSTASSTNPCAPKASGTISIPVTSGELVAVAKTPQLNTKVADYGFAADVKYGRCASTFITGRDDEGRELLMLKLRVGTTQAEVAYLVAALDKTGLFATVTQQRH